MLHGSAVALLARRAPALAALILAAFSLSMTFPAVVRAQASGPRFGRAAALLPVRLAGDAAITWDGDMALGGRVEIPIATAAALRYNTRDEVAISIGGDLALLAVDGATMLVGYPTFTFQWSLGVSDRFYFFPELGLVARIDKDGWGEIMPNLGFGARYYLRRSFGIFARIGYPFAVSAGTMF